MWAEGRHSICDWSCHSLASPHRLWKSAISISRKCFTVWSVSWARCVTLDRTADWQPIRAEKRVWNGDSLLWLAHLVRVSGNRFEWETVQTQFSEQMKHAGTFGMVPMLVEYSIVCIFYSTEHVFTLADTCRRIFKGIISLCPWSLLERLHSYLLKKALTLLSDRSCKMHTCSMYARYKSEDKTVMTKEQSE